MAEVQQQHLPPQDIECAVRVLNCLAKQPLSIDGKHPILDACRNFLNQFKSARPDGLNELRIERAKKTAQHMTTVDQHILIESDPKKETFELIENKVKNDAERPQLMPMYSKKLENPREGCYICRKDEMYTHSFYSQMCIECGNFNFEKRFQTADLTGRVAIVTGARIKIGFETALKLLRAGAQVIATTRFTADALVRFRMEKDFASFADRLYLEYLELASFDSITRFVENVKQKFARVHILINNAAQTLKRAPEFYQRETQLQLLLENGSSSTSLFGNDKDIIGRLCESTTSSTPSPHQLFLTGMPQSQLLIEQQQKQHTFEKDMIDEYGQPVDTVSKKNSWILHFDEVSPEECLEVHWINSIAPFLLIQKLSCLMKFETDNNDWGHIVNVTSMEGSFSKSFKSASHVHTNMAKASMNMITRTLAGMLKKRYNILVNSVDTGWIDCMVPQHPDFMRLALPIDVIDGAARVLDPIFSHYTNPQTINYGVFYKDYKVQSW